MEKVKAVMSWLLKSDGGSKSESQHQGFAPSGTAVSNTVSILVADINGPDGALATNRVKDILSRISGAMVKGAGRSLNISTSKTPIEGLLKAVEKGRDWLTRNQADILVWGSVEPNDKVLTLRFLPLNSAPEGRPGAIGIGDEVGLPIHYTTELDDVIIAATLCASNSTQASGRESFSERLHEFALRAEPLGAIDIPGIAQLQMVSVLQMIANVITTDAKGNADGLTRALTIYLRAIRLIPSDLMSGPRQALLYGQYASALQAKGAQGSSPEPYEQAVEAYKSALGILSRLDYPHDWALSQIRLGLTTYHLARKSDHPKIMGDAIKALEQALTIFTRATNPGRWAEVKNHIGVVMTSMGEELSNNKMLERAIEAFDDSLDVRKREQVIILWAQTTNNLGAAAFALAKRTEDQALMQQATIAFEGAISVYRQLGQENRAHIIEKNLKRAKNHFSGG